MSPGKKTELEQSKTDLERCKAARVRSENDLKTSKQKLRESIAAWEKAEKEREKKRRQPEIPLPNPEPPTDPKSPTEPEPPPGGQKKKKTSSGSTQSPPPITPELPGLEPIDETKAPPVDPPKTRDLFSGNTAEDNQSAGNKPAESEIEVPPVVTTPPPVKQRQASEEVLKEKMEELDRIAEKRRNSEQAVQDKKIEVHEKEKAAREEAEEGLREVEVLEEQIKAVEVLPDGTERQQRIGELIRQYNELEKKSRKRKAAWEQIETDKKEIHKRIEHEKENIDEEETRLKELKDQIDEVEKKQDDEQNHINNIANGQEQERQAIGEVKQRIDEGEVEDAKRTLQESINALGNSENALWESIEALRHSRETLAEVKKKWEQEYADWQKNKENNENEFTSKDESDTAQTSDVSGAGFTLNDDTDVPFGTADSLRAPYAATGKGIPKSAAEVLEAYQAWIEDADEPANVKDDEAIKILNAILDKVKENTADQKEFYLFLKNHLQHPIIVDFPPEKQMSLIPDDYPKDSEGFWVSPKEYVARRGGSVSTLQRNRVKNSGVIWSEDGTWGKDKAGNFFRKVNNLSNSPYEYFVPHE